MTVLIDDPIARQCHTLTVPGTTAEEGYAFLRSIDNGVGGAGARQFIAGATWEPIRRRYQAVDRALVEAAKARLTTLGPRPATADLEALVRQASGQRTTAARLWRMPSGPDAFLAAEARDWAKYGAGGRNFNNLMRRSESNPARATWSRDDHLLQILRNVEKTNAGVDAAVLRNARYLKAGGAILMVAGLGWTYREYQRTPQHQKAEFVRREAVTTAGGALGAGLATAVLVAVGASGAVVIGVGLVAGVAGALVAEGVYRSIYG
ncbi:MAG: hypothetical protein EOP40_06130, partial [Rubrivivax sp.]